MAEFDDDDALLAMIGDESEGEEKLGSGDESHGNDSPSSPPARSPSPAPSPPRPTTESSKQPSKRSMGSKASAKGSARRHTAGDSEEDGEASSAPGSPASLGSDAMEESDSDTSPADFDDLAADDNPYPLEGKYRDARDKAYVLSLTEVEREQVLADREEEASSKRRDLQLKSLLESKDREAEKSQKKRKAGAAQLSDSERASRPKNKRTSALDAYTRQREQAREEGRRRVNNRGQRRSHSRSSQFSQLDASGESDNEYARPSARKNAEADLPADLADIERVRVGRTRLAKVCFFPNFDGTMIGCFARVCVGQERPGVNVYRMTVIKGFRTGKPYLVDASPAVQPFYTDQYVYVSHGSQSKEWPFTHCSDSKFTEPELERWKKQLEVDGMPRTTKTAATKICSGIHSLLEHHLTSEEITNKIEKQNKYKHLFSAANTITPKRTKDEDSAERLRLRNEKIRKQNADDVRKALMAEKSKQRQALLRAQRQHNAAQAAAKDGTGLTVPLNDHDDLFSGGSDISRTASPAVGAPAPPQSSSANGVETPKRKGIPTFAKMAMDDDIISSMELSIDIDI